MSLKGLFPLTARTNAADHLEIGGFDLVDLAREYGTPVYVFDEVTLREQAVKACEAFRLRWSGSAVLYATKAYFSPFLARFYRDLGLGLDVTSEGELEIARRVGFPPDKIYLHGNNKTAAEIRAALAIGVNHFVVDNLDEISLIGAQASNHNKSPRLLLRLSPDIDPHTHRYLATGVANSKFGLAVDTGAVTSAYEEIRLYPALRLVGLHVHIGSQIFEADAIVRSLVRALDLAAEWRERFGFTLQELNLGGGWGVAYAVGQESVLVDALAQKVCETLRDGLAERHLPSSIRLVVEPGRALIARAGIALYRVGSVKRISAACTFAAIDGGMGDNIRPALYGAGYTARAANRFEAPPTRSYAIAGRYCEQGDVLIESVDLPELESGDLLAVPVSGAYQLPMASNYNLIPRPAVVLVKDGQAKLLRRRETIDDMLACDVP